MDLEVKKKFDKNYSLNRKLRSEVSEDIHFLQNILFTYLYHTMLWHVLPKECLPKDLSSMTVLLELVTMKIYR